jgi:hypothetical protein
MVQPIKSTTHADADRLDFSHDVIVDAQAIGRVPRLAMLVGL